MIGSDFLLPPSLIPVHPSIDHRYAKAPHFQQLRSVASPYSLSRGQQVDLQQGNNAPLRIGIAVISLLGSRRRQNWITYAQAKLLPDEFVFFDAVDANEARFSPFGYKAFRCERLPNRFNQEFSASAIGIGHVGCSLSHSELWMRFRDCLDQYDYFLVFEDDAVPARFFAHGFWELIDGIEAFKASGEAGPDLVFLQNRIANFLFYHPFSSLGIAQQILIRLERAARMLEESAEAPYAPGYLTSMNPHIFGTECYLLSPRAVSRLADLVESVGLYTDANVTYDSGVELHLYHWLSLSRALHRIPAPHALEGYLEQLGSEEPLLNAYFSRLPLASNLAELGLDHSSYTQPR